MVPGDTADFVTLDADPWIGIWTSGKSPLSPGFTLPPAWKDTPLSLTLYDAVFSRSLNVRVPVESVFLSEAASLAITEPLRSVFFFT